MFGLSDASIAGTPLTQLYLAAISSVVALLLLAEQLGVQLALLSHHLLHRAPRPPDVMVGPAIPRRRADALTLVKAVACATGGALILYGLARMRISYAALLSPIATALGGAFLAIQVGVFFAATLFAAHYAHPYAKDWRAVQGRLASAARALAPALRAAEAAAADFNGLLRKRDQLIAEAAHMCEATVSDAARQGKLAADTITANQPEPVTERLFPQGTPEPAHSPFHQDLTGYLSGLDSPFRRYEPASLQEVRDAEEKIREQRAAGYERGAQ